MTSTNAPNRAAIRSILLISVFAAGIETSIPTPVLAASGGFNITGSICSRIDHVATLLANGQVLVAGGFCEPQPRDPRVLSGAELYTP